LRSSIRPNTKFVVTGVVGFFDERKAVEFEPRLLNRVLFCVLPLHLGEAETLVRGSAPMARAAKLAETGRA